MVDRCKTGSMTVSCMVGLRSLLRQQSRAGRRDPRRACVGGLGGDRLTGWPRGMRLVIRKERLHPGAQFRFTDADGMWLTCFATDTKNVPIAAVELRHCQRGRAEDRVRAARATGLRNRADDCSSVKLSCLVGLGQVGCGGACPPGLVWRWECVTPD